MVLEAELSFIFLSLDALSFIILWVQKPSQKDRVLNFEIGIADAWIWQPGSGIWATRMTFGAPWTVDPPGVWCLLGSTGAPDRSSAAVGGPRLRNPSPKAWPKNSHASHEHR